MEPPPNLLAAAKGLKIEINGPNTVQSVADLKLTATVTNTADESLTLINDPSGILSYSEIPTNKCNVVHSSGTIPKFTGAMVKFSPKAAAESGAVTVLAPGQSSTAFDHDLSRTYDFTQSGEGLYVFRPRSRVYFVDPTTKEVHSTEVDTIPEISVHISGRLLIPHEDT